MQLFNSHFGLLTLMASMSAYGAGIDDRITIEQVFATSEGSVAVQASTAIPNASNARDCLPGQTWETRWAGVGPEAHDRLISVLLSAHAQGKEIEIRTVGCHGAWHEISTVYIRP